MAAKTKTTTELEQIITDLEKQLANKDKRIASLQQYKKQVPFDVAFNTLVDQLKSEIDGDTEGYLSNDHNRPLPSQRDMGLRIVLSQLTQTIHNQLAGTPKNSNKGAQHFLNMYRATRDSSEFQARYARKELTGDDMNLLHQIAIQSARVAFLSLLKDTFQATYEKTTGENWKPYDGTNAAGEKAKPFKQEDIDRLMRA